ncbi:uracil-DNA glycosylase [Undibacterium sp. RuRC25W]|uniref:uracil-DNA glycosylase n=1 Tax=Undibacterium sp. RuRC25W TaxID=3413047 RepID=UPI003BF60843
MLMHPVDAMSQSAIRVAILNEMGLGPVWTQRYADNTVQVADGAVSEGAPVVPLAAVVSVPAHDDQSDILNAASSVPDYPFDMSAEQVSEQAYSHHDKMILPESNAVVRAVSAFSWSELEESVAACRACGLCEGRQKIVFGVGAPTATWLFVGEGPGYNEDLQGEPFVGAAGQLLDNMLLALGVRRGDRTYIANVVKCRATDHAGKDRPPTAEEIATCLPYLERQIALIKPKVIVALGKTAAIALSGVDIETPVAQLRGKIHTVSGIPMVATYHPAYLLRKPLEKSKAWQDLCLAQKALDGNS